MNSSVSRRGFIKTSAGLGLAALSVDAQVAGTLSASAQAKEPGEKAARIPIVDTHQHLWDPSKQRLPGLDDPEAAPLRHRFMLSEYDEATAKANVVKTVYMEVDCDPSQHRSEADSVIRICRAPGSRMRGAVIGGKVQSADFPAYIAEYAQNPYVKGVRIVLNNPHRPKGLCLERQFVENVRLLGRLGLSFDLCLRPEDLLDGVLLSEKCPQTRFIMDHCGNMKVQSNDAALRRTWEHGIKSAAARPNMVCKISGIVANTRNKDWTPDDLAPIVNFCLDSFGDERVFFGGDWPVCTLRATFQRWVDALTSIVRDRPVEFQRKLFHDNAVRFYKLS